MMMARSVRTAFLASLLLVDCQRATPSPFPPMDLNQPFKTHCVGRMLIDLPEEIRQYPDSLPGGYVKLFYGLDKNFRTCLLYTSPSPRDRTRSRMPSSA